MPFILQVFGDKPVLDSDHTSLSVPSKFLVQSQWKKRNTEMTKKGLRQQKKEKDGDSKPAGKTVTTSESERKEIKQKKKR